MIFSLYARLFLAGVVVVALAGGSWKSYSMGKASVQAAWNADKLVQATAIIKAEQAARAVEQVLIVKNQKVANDYQVEKKRRVAAAVISADRLRQLELAASATITASADTPTTSGDYGDPRPLIVAQCARAITKLDEAVKGLAGQTGALQDYAANVCINTR